MIAKTKANKSFRGTTKYVVEKAKASIIGGNMIGTETDQLVAQFMVSRNLNPKVKEPCYHLMLSLPHSETLSDSQFASLGERHFATVVVLSQLTGDKAKLTNPDQRISEAELNSKVDKFLDDEIHQYSFFIARHNDKDHDHIHIVASRINEITTHAIKTWKQYPQSEWSARLLEKKFGLEQIPCSWESKTKALTRSQRDRLENDGLPGAEIMRLAIDEAAQDKPTMPVLIERLAQKGIMAEVSYKNNGQVRGIRFSINVGEIDNFGNPKLLTMTGGGLNRHKYSFPKLLSELGVSYIPERDDKFLKATIGNAQKLLIVSPIINISPTSSNEVKESSYPSPESTNKLEQQKEKLRRIIDTAAANQPTFTQFIEHLQSRGINPRILLTRTGRIQGISYESSGEEFSGTSLGANYSFSGLQRHFGVDFNLERDVEAIAAIACSNSKRKSAIQNQSTQSIKKLLLENQDKRTFSVTPELSSQSLDISDERASQQDISLSEPLNQPIQLNDIELLKLVRTVNQWQKTCPTEPKLELGQSYRKCIDSLNKQKAYLERKLRSIVEELKQLGKPRSLLNPFGVKAEVIEGKRLEIWSTKMALSDIKLQLSQTEANFKQWHKEARTYLAWLENPQTQKMNELAKLLNSPLIQERLQRIEQGYAIHEAACYILDKKGISSEEGRYFQGNSYRIEQRVETLIIFHKDRSEPIYEATDRRSAGGIIEISQFNLTEPDRKIIRGYVQDLEEQNRKKSHQVGRGGFGIGG
jgi:2'-5' RNA ligase